MMVKSSVLKCIRSNSHLEDVPEREHCQVWVKHKIFFIYYSLGIQLNNHANISFIHYLTDTKSRAVASSGLTFMCHQMDHIL